MRDKPLPMDYSELFGLLKVDDVPPKVLRLAVTAILDRTEESDLRADWLADIEARLVAGEDCLEELRQFADSILAEAAYPVEGLWNEMQELVARFDDSDWKTERYLAFEAHWQDPQYLGDLRENLQQSQAEYEAGYLTSSEVTSETYVAHLLFTKGIQQWLEAVEAAYQEEGETALARAETGSRYLAAIQILRMRIESLCN